MKNIKNLRLISVQKEFRVACLVIELFAASVRPMTSLAAVSL